MLMSLEVLSNSKSELVNADPNLLRAAVNNRLEDSPEQKNIDAEFSNFKVIEYIADTVSEDFIMATEGGFKDPDYHLKVDRMFDFGVTRMCFAIGLLANKRHPLLSAGVQADALPQGLKLMWDSQTTPQDIKAISEEFTATNVGLMDKGLTAAKQQAVQYNALHTLAFDIGIKARNKYYDQNGYPFGLMGGITALGVLGKLIDVCIDDEAQKEGVSKEWMKFVEEL
jgi:hypothetical protein